MQRPKLKVKSFFAWDPHSFYDLNSERTSSVPLKKSGLMKKFLLMRGLAPAHPPSPSEGRTKRTKLPIDAHKGEIPGIKPTLPEIQ
jgi:hypothetical protein